FSDIRNSSVAADTAAAADPVQVSTPTRQLFSVEPSIKLEDELTPDDLHAVTGSNMLSSTPAHSRTSVKRASEEREESPNRAKARAKKSRQDRKGSSSRPRRAREESVQIEPEEALPNPSSSSTWAMPEDEEKPPATIDTIKRQSLEDDRPRSGATANTSRALSPRTVKAEDDLDQVMLDVDAPIISKRSASPEAPASSPPPPQFARSRRIPQHDHTMVYSATAVRQELFSATTDESSSESDDESAVAKSWTAHPHIIPPPPLETDEVFWTINMSQPTRRFRSQQKRAKMLRTNVLLRRAVLVYTNWDMREDDEDVRSLVEEQSGSRNAEVCLLDNVVAYNMKQNERQDEVPSCLAFIVCGSAALKDALLASAVWTRRDRLIIFREPVISVTGQYRFFRISPVASDVEDRELKNIVHEGLSKDMKGTEQEMLDTSKTLVYRSKTRPDHVDIRVKFNENQMSDQLFLPMQISKAEVNKPPTLKLGKTTYRRHAPTCCRLCQGGAHRWKDCPLHLRLGLEPLGRGDGKPRFAILVE
ncbi:hypothetical protein BD626DRAFT_513007, partial [Schizophyllum amplum]